jgi:thiosulfate/3-mercaptopyruvate sulfurtransferase
LPVLAIAVFYLIVPQETIIDPSIAQHHTDDESWAFIDCRFVLREPDRGEQEYEKSHLPGAVYAHLNRDLSGPIVPGVTGRHPLPSHEALVGALSRLGVGSTTQVVAYDESNGSMAAARLWWLLKWAGHDAVAVLDGGMQKWRTLGLPTARGVLTRRTTQFAGRFRSDMIVEAGQVLSALNDPDYVVLDSRSRERYQGLNETIDPVAGHIRGALSAPHEDNVRDDGTFKAPRELLHRFDSLVRNREAAHVVFYCGSGVTAAHNVLAFAHAGKGVPLLYPGSWSEWITVPGRPIAVGKV